MASPCTFDCRRPADRPTRTSYQDSHPGKLQLDLLVAALSATRRRSRSWTSRSWTRPAERGSRLWDRVDASQRDRRRDAPQSHARDRSIPLRAPSGPAAISALLACVLHRACMLIGPRGPELNARAQVHPRPGTQLGVNNTGSDRGPRNAYPSTTASSTPSGSKRRSGRRSSIRSRPTRNSSRARCIPRH